MYLAFKVGVAAGQIGWGNNLVNIEKKSVPMTFETYKGIWPKCHASESVNIVVE